MLNNTLEQAAEASLSNRFETVAALFDDNLALVSDTESTTYRQLNSIANKLAKALLNTEVSQGERVALLMSHDAPLFAGMLAILKAGMVVVSLNPFDPPARLQAILEDASVAAILTDSAHVALAEQLAQNGQRLLQYEMHQQMAAADNPELSIEPGSMAFLIYTSGTTGHPKGVMQTHRNVLHNALRLSRGMQIQPQDRLLLLSALSGGQAISTTWCALSNGAALCPYPAKQRGLADLADWITEKQVSVYVSSASLFRTFMKSLDPVQSLPTVRLVRLGSEAATDSELVGLQQHFPPDCLLLNSLSSSETGNITQLGLSSKDIIQQPRLPVGFPAAGMDVLLLDADGKTVAPGEIGEIVVKSDYLSPGYWRNPDLTAQKFRELHEGNSLQRLFFSGDLGWRDSQGRLNYLGRSDHQIKIRGFRVELFEIEQTLKQVTDVVEAIVEARNRADGEPRLIGYVVAKSGHALTPAALREALLCTLPDYMVPTSFVLLADFPLNAHGKVDRDALAKMDGSPTQNRLDEPQQGIKAMLAAIWAEALGRDKVSGDDSFFDLGGDSLSAMLIAARVRKQWHVELRLQLFAENPTLSAMTAWLDHQLINATRTIAEPIAVVDRTTQLPVAFIQERVWQESQTAESAAGYAIAACYKLKGPLDRELLQQCIDVLADRYEILRTTFPAIDGQPYSLVNQPQPMPLPYVDLSSAPESEQLAMADFNRYAETTFDLECGPLVLFRLIQVGFEDYRLLRVHHHIISDGPSWKIYFDELASIYHAAKHGEPSPLTEPPPLQYIDYVAWQRKRIAAGAKDLHVGLDWWQQHLGNCPAALTLPFQRNLPAINVSPDSGYVNWYLSEASKAELENIARTNKSSYFVVQLAAFVALLANETGQQHLTIGTYLTNRNRVEWQNMFGFFADLAMLRFDCDKRLSFRDWIESVGKVLSDTEAHAEIPYQMLCDELRLREITPPAISALFVVATQFKPLKFADIELSMIERRRVGMPWGFTLAVSLQSQNTTLETRFDADQYDPKKVARFMRQYRRLLELVCRFPDYSLSRLIWLAKLDDFLDRSKAIGKVFSRNGQHLAKSI